MPVTSTVFVRTTIAFLLIGLLTLIAIVGASLWIVGRSDEAADSLVATQQLRRQVFEVLAGVQGAETGQRGFLLTLDPRYLEPYEDARRELDEDTERLRQLALGRPAYEDFAARLEEMVATKLGELQETIDLARAGEQDQALDIVRSERGRESMDAIESVIDELIETSDAELAVRAEDLRQGVRTLTWSQAIGGLLIIVVIGGTTWIASRYTRELEAARREVEALAASLEERVNERTADLQRANEEVQRFAYIVSHDLRSPLVNIMGFTSELESGLNMIRERFADLPKDEEDPAAEEVRLAIEEDMPEAIAFIRSSTGKMDNLINAILRLSREGRRMLNPERVDMTELLENAAGSVQHVVAETEGEISVETPVPDVLSDRLALEQIFGNLVDNAVKYRSPKRPLQIVLRGRQLGFQVEFEVEDNGRGISADDRERVFELFRRAGSQDSPGEGIGLTHVRALARRLGGDVSLDSELGRGTTFRVRLPKTLPHALRES